MIVVPESEHVAALASKLVVAVLLTVSDFVQETQRFVPELNINPLEHPVHVTVLDA